MAESKEILTGPIEELKPEVKIEDLEKIREEEKLPAGVETWMRKVEKVKTTAVTDDSQTLTTPPPQGTKNVLPTGRKTFVTGFKKTIEEAGRWLSVFVLRLIKMKKGEVEFKKEE